MSDNMKSDINIRSARVLTLNGSRPVKSAAVIGAARSGLSAVKVLSKMGCDVLLSDTCKPEKLEAILASAGISNIRHEAGGHTDAVLASDLIVLSPGVPSDIPVLKQAAIKNIPVWSEIELAYRLCSAPFAAVTGSTGKSTTVSFLGAILSAAGRDHVVAGNIGFPLSSAAPQVSADGVIVAEISSFQLETIDTFRPRAAAILNFLKNHLDRYESEQAYYDAKKEIARNMGRSDVLVLNACDDLLVAYGAEMRSRAKVMFFGRNVPGHDCVWCENGTIFIRRGTVITPVIEVKNMYLKGPHNWDNASAAVALASVFGINEKAMADGIAGFRGLPHRLEYVCEKDGVSFYNDSKATTSESVLCALNAFLKNVHLICGGRDKGCDFSGIRHAVIEHAKSVICIGEAAERIMKEWDGVENIVRAGSLAEAVDTAFANAVPGDVVLLSPGCSSYDMFSSYEERGDVFRKLAHELAAKGNSRA
jgi:UDP-N-acetylmuramoylalanine--D-glutamate ligase